MEKFKSYGIPDKEIPKSKEKLFLDEKKSILKETKKDLEKFKKEFLEWKSDKSKTLKELEELKKKVTKWKETTKINNQDSKIVAETIKEIDDIISSISNENNTLLANSNEKVEEKEIIA